MDNKIPERKPNEKISYYFARNHRFFAEEYRKGKTYEAIGEMLRELFPNYSLKRHSINKQFGVYLTREDRLARAIYDINKKSNGKTLIAPSSRLLRDDYRLDNRISN